MPQQLFTRARGIVNLKTAEKSSTTKVAEPPLAARLSIPGDGDCKPFSG